MPLTEYTSARAEKLGKLSIPGAELPADTRILWVEPVDYNSAESRICTGFHAHSFFEIHFVFSGSANYVSDGMLYAVSAGKALFVPPDTPHGFIDCSCDMIKISVAFALGKNSIMTEMPCDKKPVVFEFSQDITDNANFILKLSDNENIFMPHIASGRVLEIIHSACLGMNVAIPRICGKCHDPRVNVAKEFIENNAHRIITCNDVASECCLSVRQLNRIFKNGAGCSVYEYINAMRTKRAKKLLAESAYSIKEIGYMMGFESECGFVSFFKRQCGVPPGEFRRQSGIV